MQRAIWWLITILGVTLGGFILYHNIKRAAPPPAISQPEPRVQAPAPVPLEEPSIQFPVPVTPAAKTLPALDASDAAVRDALATLTPGKDWSELAVFKDIVRRVVATVDNLPARKLAPRLLPLQAARGSFAVSGGDQQFSIALRNAARYAPYVRLVQALDSAKLVAIYIEYYPLFQQAYRDMGYPKGNFNDRLIGVIDHLLAAPDLGASVALVRPKVFYLYADADLEARSAGQKLLMRMGSENEAAIKTKLRGIRAEITHQSAVATPAKP